MMGPFFKSILMAGCALCILGQVACGNKSTLSPKSEQMPEEWSLPPEELPEFKSEGMFDKESDISSMMGKDLRLQSYCPKYKPEKFSKRDFADLEGTYQNISEGAGSDSYVKIFYKSLNRYKIREQSSLDPQQPRVIKNTFASLYKISSLDMGDTYVGIVNRSPDYAENLDRYDACSFVMLMKPRVFPGGTPILAYGALGIRVETKEDWLQFKEAIHRDNNEAIGKDSKVYFKEGSFKYLNYFLDAQSMVDMFKHKETQKVLTLLQPYRLTAVDDKGNPIKVARPLFQKDNKGEETVLKNNPELDWLHEQAKSGDMWAKYFLARAHLLAGLKANVHETFESLALPSEARPYWGAFWETFQQENFKGDIFIAGQLSEEGVRAEFGPLMSLRGFMYLKGLGGLPLDYKEAFGLYRQAADHETASAMLYLGWLYQTGKGVEKNFSEAVRWYRKGADLGHALSMMNLGIMYFNGQGVPKDVGEGMRWNQKAANLGNSDAMYQLGWHYANGVGVSRNYSEAVQWYQKAADRDYARAMNHLGLHYLTGTGVEKDLAKGISWVQRSAEYQDTVAMQNLGAFYAKGQFGLSQSWDQAINWYEKAADLGDTNAMFELGLLYQHGPSYIKDEGKAWLYHQNAAERGNDKAMVAYALLIKKRGERGDEQFAVKWLKEAEETTNDPKLREEIHEVLAKRKGKDSGISFLGKIIAGAAAVAIIGSVLSGPDDGSSSAGEVTESWHERDKESRDRMMDALGIAELPGI